VTPAKFFWYDTSYYGSSGTNTMGRLVAAGTCQSNISCAGNSVVIEEFGYSPRGELTDVWESTPHSGGWYHTTGSYWAHGGLNTLGLLSNSGGSLIPLQTYGLDGEGRVTKVTASSGQNPVTGVTYTTSGTTQPIGSLTQASFGSGDSDTFSYATNTGRLTQYKFNMNTLSVTGNLTWNASGSLKTLSITDQVNTANSQTCNYTYDNLARVKTANCGTIWNQTFNPDAFGNLTKTATVGISFLPTYSLSTNHYQSVSGCTPSYDANGFATNDCAHSYTWDAAGNPRSVDTVNLTYDALGRVVEQAVGSVFTEIVYNPTGGKLALMNGQTLQKAFVPLPAGATAVYTSTGLAYYRHADWLGSSRFSDHPQPDEVLRRGVRALWRELRGLGHHGPELHRPEPGHGVRTLRFSLPRIQSGARPLALA